jgi:hypothetical protein
VNDPGAWPSTAEVDDVANDTALDDGRPKLHGVTVLSRLAGAGVVLQDLATAAAPDRVLLQIGDTATYVAFDGTFDEVDAVVRAAAIELADLREHRLRRRAPL